MGTESESGSAKSDADVDWRRTIGGVVTGGAMPRQDGRKRGPVRGIVVGRDPFGDDTRMLVWYPALGVPLRDTSCWGVPVARTAGVGALESMELSWAAKAYRVAAAALSEGGEPRAVIERQWGPAVLERLRRMWQSYNESRRVPR